MFFLESYFYNVLKSRTFLMKNCEKHKKIENLMRHEVKKIKSLKSDSQAGLPNAGPMAVEDCLAANIRQNKVPIYENLLST